MYAESGCIMLVDDIDNELKVRVSYELDKKVAEKISIKMGEGINPFDFLFSPTESLQKPIPSRLFLPYMTWYPPTS